MSVEGGLERKVESAVAYFAARQQFLKLLAESQPVDGKSAQASAQLREEIAHALESLSAPQWDVLSLSLQGWSLSEIGKALGIARCTVWDRLLRARENVLEETEQAMTRNRLLAKGHILDMRDADVLESLLLILTPAQAACFYIYFAEGFSENMAGKLLGHGQSPVHQAITTALRNIDILLAGQDVILSHPEALDDLGYKVYCELRSQPELDPKGAALPMRRRSRTPKKPPLRPLPCRWAVHVQVWHRRRPTEKLKEKIPEVPLGRLHAALVKDGKNLFEGLKTVFSVCRYKIEQQRIANDRR